MSESHVTVTLSPAELERLLRRIVREEVSRVLQPGRRTILHDWSHEGVEEPGDEEELTRLALEAIEEHDANPQGALTWDEFEAELDRAEANGELPD